MVEYATVNVKSIRAIIVLMIKEELKVLLLFGTKTGGLSWLHFFSKNVYPFLLLILGMLLVA